MREYYDRRAPEYDDWYRGVGLYEERDRPGWAEEFTELTSVVSALPPCRILDVACGTGFLTRHLTGDVVGLDQSEAMLEVARRQAPAASFVRGEALELPFPDGAFGRVFTGHFYGHLDVRERAAFLAEARRVASELVVVDSALREGVEPEEWQLRELSDGSRFRIYKRHFRGPQLAEELGGGGVLLDGRWFAAVRAQSSRTRRSAAQPSRARRATCRQPANATSSESR